jgi:hypothetical protein
VASARLRVAKAYFGDELSGIDLRVGSVVDPSLSASYAKQFGIVFSMHCLEQVPNHAAAAVDNMVSLSSGRVIMIEPDWDCAYPAQRIFLIISDHMRTLLATCRAKGLNILKAERTTVQSSLKNPSTLIAIDVTRVTDKQLPAGEPAT